MGGLCNKVPEVEVVVPPSIASRSRRCRPRVSFTIKQDPVNLEDYLSVFATQLGLPDPVCIQKVDDAVGAHNLGVWKLSSNDKSFLLKLVPYPDEETEEFELFIERRPELKDDSRICLPLLIVGLVNGEDMVYLVQIYRWVCRATSLADLMAKHWISHRPDLLDSLVRNFGIFLLQWHSFYKHEISHNDLTASNVLVVEEEPPSFVLVDCLGISNEGDDRGSFLRCIDFLSSVYGKHFTQVASKAFIAGYDGIRTF